MTNYEKIKQLLELGFEVLVRYDDGEWARFTGLSDNAGVFRTIRVLEKKDEKIQKQMPLIDAWTYNKVEGFLYSLGVN